MAEGAGGEIHAEHDEAGQAGLAAAVARRRGCEGWALGEEDIQAHAAWMGTEYKLYSRCNSYIPNGTIALLV